MTGRPDSAQQQAAEQLDLRKRMREVQEAILARTPEHDLEPSLDRIAAVMELLGDPQRAFPVIHVTGTNGKTTTTLLIGHVLQAAGVVTGITTTVKFQSNGEVAQATVNLYEQKSGKIVLLGDITKES